MIILSHGLWQFVQEITQIPVRFKPISLGCLKAVDGGTGSCSLGRACKIQGTSYFKIQGTSYLIIPRSQNSTIQLFELHF